MLFYYRGRNFDGEEISGIYEADDGYAIAKMLKAQGFTPVAIRKYRPRTLKSFRLLLNKDYIEDLAVFCQELSVLIDTGVPIIDSLNIIREQIGNLRFRKTVDNVIYQLGQGFTLAEACQKHPEVFPEVFVYTIEAGELAGQLELVLDKLSAYYRGMVRRRGKIKNIMIYPAILGIVSFAVFSFLILRVLPTLTNMFIQQDSKIPVPTKILLFLGDNYYTFLSLFLAVLIVLFILFLTLYNSGHISHFYDKIVFDLPVIGTLQKKKIAANFCRTLSLLLGSGIPILKALDVVSKTIKNNIVKGELEKITAGIKQGLTFSGLLSKQIFPSIMIKVVAIGEETGTLGLVLNKTAVFLEGEIDCLEERLMGLIEPIIIVSLAVIIGFIVLGILMPMVDIYNYI